jgi:cytochrome c-type protein NapC
MTTIDKPAPRPGFLKRTWDFALELLDVLIRPSSVFAFGVLVLAGSSPAWCSGAVSTPRWS